MFAVVVTFQIKAEHVDAFLPLMIENAKASLDNEPDCIQFDVCVDQSRAGSVFLYEIYTDQAAFDVHLASEHFIAFDRAVAPMVEAKQVQTYARIQS